MRFSKAVLATVLSVGFAAGLFLWGQTRAAADGMSVESLSAAEAAKLAAAQAVQRPIDRIIRLTPNKTKIIHLREDAGSVVVSNPRHASVLIDSPRTLIIVPRAPGATAFTVLDNRGRVIAERDVIVTSQETNYIRIRKYCASGDNSCQPAATYFCPDGCFEIATESVDDAAGNTAQQAQSISGSGNSAPDDAGDENAEEPAENPADNSSTAPSDAPAPQEPSTDEGDVR